MSHKQESIGGEVFTRILLLLLGLMLMIPAANTFLTYCHFYLFGIHTHGIVARTSSGKDLGGRPLIQYKDQLGDIHEFKSRAKTHWFKNPVKGEKIEIFIDKNEPKKVIVNTLYHYVFLPLLLVVAGVYCCLKGIWFDASRRRKTEHC